MGGGLMEEWKGVEAAVNTLLLKGKRDRAR